MFIEYDVPFGKIDKFNKYEQCLQDFVDSDRHNMVINFHKDEMGHLILHPDDRKTAKAEAQECYEEMKESIDLFNNHHGSFIYKIEKKDYIVILEKILVF